MNFKEWLHGLKSVQTIQVNMETVRDFYLTPDKKQIMVDTIIPYNVFKKSFEIVVLCLSIENTAENINKLRYFLGEPSNDYYTDDEHFTPLFKGENAFENAFNYSQA